jgi:hypothetical protein
VDECLQDNGVFSDIDFKSVGRPAAHPLNDIVRNTGEGERSGSARVNGMATNTGAESGLQA